MNMAALADDKFADALRQYCADRFSGLLRVDGQPGGTIYLADGAVCACETSGAPGLEVILLRSGRLTESDWEAAFSAAAVSGTPMTDGLLQRDLVGAGELEALLRTVLADAVFALVSGRVDGWAEGPPADCLLPLAPPARPGWLLAEAARRRQVLASLSEPALNARVRAVAVRGTARASRVPGQGQEEILALADGRRSARDLAFALGRGLYETLLQLARMRAGNMLVISSYGKEPPSPGRSVGQAPGGDGDWTATGLPRRRGGRQGAARTGETGRRGFTANIRMLRPRSEENDGPPASSDP